MQKKTSSFWLDESVSYDVLTGESIQIGKDYHKMAGTLRAISNFVNIVTGKSIPVKYSTKDESYTDGQSVVISGNIKQRDFDPTVGLALHEGSHCLLTDFNIVKKLYRTIPSDLIIDIAKKHKGNIDAESIDFATDYIFDYVKSLLNYVEDRRIDHHIYTSAPGYRGYYKAMYDKYFNATIIDKALQSTEKTSEDWESYMFRIINLTNQHRNLDALIGLNDVWKALDLTKISRLKSTSDALTVAIDIFKIVESNIEVDTSAKSKSEEAEDGIKTNEIGSTGEESESNGEGSESDDGSTTTGENVDDKSEFSDKQLHSLKKKIEAQTSFIDGEVNKSNVSKTDSNKIEALKESGSTMKTVGENHLQRYGKSNGTQCIVIKNVTQKLIDSGLYSTLDGSNSWRQVGTSSEAISTGMRLGNMLGRKLQIRNDETSLKYNRLRKGRIDKRMIASLGFGNEQVFEQIFVDRFKPVKLHLSIDASGSMNGDKWTNAQISAIAIAKAASMVQNLGVVISYRSAERVGSDILPAIFIAYDSTKDKISKIPKIFPNITCPGSTPEGLCFEAIQSDILNGSANLDSYFINFSDGEPTFGNNSIHYSGQEAQTHTRKQVENMRSRGIVVLSYFIEDTRYSSSYSRSAFNGMYGKDAEFIDPTKLFDLTKSLNSKFATA